MICIDLKTIVPRIFEESDHKRNTVHFLMWKGIYFKKSSSSLNNLSNSILTGRNVNSSSNSMPDWNILYLPGEMLQRVIRPLKIKVASAVTARSTTLEPGGIRSRLSINAPNLEILIRMTSCPPTRLMLFKVGIPINTSKRGALLRSCKSWRFIFCPTAKCFLYHFVYSLWSSKSQRHDRSKTMFAKLIWKIWLFCNFTRPACRRRKQEFNILSRLAGISCVSSAAMASSAPFIG